jgi:hypothetical protein
MRISRDLRLLVIVSNETFLSEEKDFPAFIPARDSMDSLVNELVGEDEDVNCAFDLDGPAVTIEFVMDKKSEELVFVVAYLEPIYWLFRIGIRSF